jgi:NAD-dependent DNA ligase
MTDLEKFILARWAYSIGTDTVSDAEYTLLANTVKSTTPEGSAPYLNRSWSLDPCPTQLLKKYGLEHQIKNIVSTDKAESIPSVNDFSTLYNIYFHMTTPAVLSMKHDGWNIQAHYYNGSLVSLHTRGRVKDAMDVSVLASHIPTDIPQSGSVVIGLEVTLPNAHFKQVKEMFGNSSQRGAVSTLLAHSKFSHLLVLHAFKIDGVESASVFEKLKSWGFLVPKYREVSNYIQLVEGLKELSEIVTAGKYDFPTDGVVVADALSTNAVRLFHWEETIHKSYVTGICEEFSCHNITPILRIYPIALQNSVQRRLSATNISRIISLGLRIGAPVAFRLVSSAIADIDEQATIYLHKTIPENAWDYYAQNMRYNEMVKNIER